MVKLSIIIPVFNGQNYISDCLESVLKQDFMNSEYEVIVINSGSTDKTQVIIDAF